MAKTNKERFLGVPCPQNGCETVFSGTKLQIINNFKTHFRGTHIKGDEDLNFDVDKVREKISESLFEKELKKENDIFDILNEAFEDTFKYNEPETSVEDESVVAQEVNDEDIGSKYDLVNYLSFPPLCKEERQFALYFANKLQNKDGAIINSLIEHKLLDKDEKIKEVFFEVAIMRDYWHSNKQQFNEALIDYVTSSSSKFPEGLRTKDDYKKDEVTQKKGKDFKKHANSWTPPNVIARWMMNAKPDIGLITEQHGKYKLSFIECKYTSNEVEYKHEDISNSLKQSDLQAMILDFITNKLGAKYKNYPLEKGIVKVVRFVIGDKSSGNEIKIPIKELIS